MSVSKTSCNSAGSRSRQFKSRNHPQCTTQCAQLPLQNVTGEDLQNKRAKQSFSKHLSRKQRTKRTRQNSSLTNSHSLSPVSFVAFKLPLTQATSAPRTTKRSNCTHTLRQKMTRTIVHRRFNISLVGQVTTSAISSLFESTINVPDARDLSPLMTSEVSSAPAHCNINDSSIECHRSMRSPPVSSVPLLRDRSCQKKATMSSRRHSTFCSERLIVHDTATRASWRAHLHGRHDISFQLLESDTHSTLMIVLKFETDSFQLQSTSAVKWHFASQLFRVQYGTCARLLSFSLEKPAPLEAKKMPLEEKRWHHLKVTRKSCV